MHSKTRITMNRRDATTAVAATAIGAVWSTETSAAADTNEEASKMDYDAIVVGGGPSGLSAALVLGRSCRKVLVCDAGQPRNRTSPAVHSFFSRDGIRPVELLKIGREQLKPYDVSFHDGRVTNAQRSNPGFRVQTESGETFLARNLILATGVTDDLPELEGLADLWGTGVYHCPYCHGWEVRKKPWAYMADAGLAVEWGLELQCWAGELTYCSGGTSELTDADREKLRELGIEIREQSIKRILSESNDIRGIEFTDGESLDVEAFFIRAPVVPRSSLAKQLGCKLVSMTGVYSDTAETDQFGATSVPGVYVVGDASVGAPQVTTAVTDGAMAATMINKSLVKDGVPSR